MNDDSTLAIQIRGIFNELQLQDLKKKTLRGQMGQKRRGFTVGERTLGYRSVPVGEIRMDRKGRPRTESYRMEIEPREAAVVLRIFQAYGDGMSLTKIARMLYEEGIPGQFRTSEGWSPGTVGRILDNEKYNGRWVWKKSCRKSEIVPGITTSQHQPRKPIRRPNRTGPKACQMAVTPAYTPKHQPMR